MFLLMDTYNNKKSFIAFEGIAGAGKSTQVKLLSDYLTSLSKDVFISAAYEGFRRKIVSDFMNSGNIKSDDISTMFLFQSLHRLQYKEVREALNSSKFVVADRWRESFFAHHLYQNTFKNNIDLLYQLDSLTFENLEPDLCFFLDLPSEVAYERYLQREKVLDDNGLNLMDLNYFVTVSDYYKNVAKEKNWITINAVKDIKEISQTIIEALSK